jgi:hypothetical protein
MLQIGKLPQPETAFERVIYFPQVLNMGIVLLGFLVGWSLNSIVEIAASCKRILRRIPAS